ncbi:MAG: DUF4330 domain-containing protein [Nostocaceae cyanobacterium]|nr:DUF4330 domain-containing protein [Nostocaceae cyanobacterium]
MKILDSQGRLFGKVSILDFGAGLLILLVGVAIFIFPGTSGSVAQIGAATKTVEIVVLFRGENVLDSNDLFQQGLKAGGKSNIIIRKEPHGEISIKSVKILPKTVLVPQPDGSLKELPDFRANQFSVDMLLTLVGNALFTDTGPVIGNTKLKVGAPIELEGFNYDFSNGTVIAIRMK